MLKHNEYAIKLMGAITEVLTDPENEFYIDKQELLEGDNMTDFIHALANLTPCLFYGNITGDSKSSLEFNHLANHLVFQYSKAED